MALRRLVDGVQSPGKKSIRSRVAGAYYRYLSESNVRKGAARSKHELGQTAKKTLEDAKKETAYGEPYETKEPLVSVCVATYNRADLLVNRSISSILAQSYKRLEIVVVGDACTDGTTEKIAKISDPRLRFVNLPRRGDYPSSPMKRWMVAGSAPMNHALQLSSGHFITHLDDDDEYLSNRLEALVGMMQREKPDLIFHPFDVETQDGEWKTNEALAFRCGSVTTSSIFYHRWFRQLGWDPLAYRYEEPGDWNRLRKIAYLGASIKRYPESLLKHYRERNQSSG